MALAGALSLRWKLSTTISMERRRLAEIHHPVREVGDRFQNVYFSATHGNRELAHCMSDS